MSVHAQTKLAVGSFIAATKTEGDLIGSKMYRVKATKGDDKYVILDTNFCGTEALKNKTITFGDRFVLLSEDAVKAEFKTLLKDKGFVSGQEFADVRSGQHVTIMPSSRSHVLAKFGKFMGVKIAGGHAWFAGKKWAETQVDTEVLPEETKYEAGITELPVVEYGLHVDTKARAVEVVNVLGSGDKDWVEYWESYGEQTIYTVDGDRLVGYCSLSWASDENMPIVTYEDWHAITFPAPKEEVKPKKRVSLTGGSIEEQILAVVDEHLDSSEARKHISESVETLLNQWGIDKNVRQLEVKVNEKEYVKVGKVHYKYDLVLKCMIARTNVALVGPAGSGKTTTVAKAAEALELKFYSKSVSAQTGAHEFFGYQDAQGRYVRTLFRDAYEHGGVFLLDEFDAGNPNVLAALNQATANEHCAFADGMISKHPDFICVMAGNTFGHGANSEYVGRNKIDAATLDRFAFIDFPYDEDLEYALATHKDWCKKVQKLRKKVEQKKIRTIISPRATIIGGQLLGSGVSEKDTMELLIYKGLNQEERNLLKG